MFVTMKNRTDLQMGHVGSETKSLSHWEKLCVLSRRLSFDPISMKLCQNVCHHKITDKLKLGHVRSESRS